MATLEKRIETLEAQTASAEHSVRIFFRDVGESTADARATAGIPLDYAGKVVCVRFVEGSEAHHGLD